MYNTTKVQDQFLFTTQMETSSPVFYMNFASLSVFCGSNLFNLFQLIIQIIQIIQIIIVSIAK